MGAVRNSARSGSTGLATPASCLLRSPPVLRVPAYRLALGVGSVATPRLIMQAVFPWRQGMPHGDIIASVLSFPNLNGYVRTPTLTGINRCETSPPILPATACH